MEKKYFKDLKVGDCLTLDMFRINGEYVDKRTYWYAIIKHIEQTNDCEILRISYKTAKFQHTILVGKNQNYYCFHKYFKRGFKYSWPNTKYKWYYHLVL